MSTAVYPAPVPSFELAPYKSLDNDALALREIRRGARPRWAAVC